jgi:hypothetical protein
MAAQQRRASTSSLAAPIGGWNARDSIAEMSPLDAVTLTNMFPTPSDVQLRYGYTQYSTGITGQVYSLMNYSAPTSEKLFSVADGVIYNSTSQAAATSVFTGLTNSKFQHINISNAGGHFLVACNGADPTMIYDGSAWFKVATTTTAQTISSITRSGTTATLTTGSAHGLITGNRVTITGATANDYNGTYVITVTGATTFTYVMATTPAANATVVGTYTVIGITGVDSSTFINVNLFKNRLWFTQKDTLKVWYLDVNSIGGAANALDLSGIARNGGFLQAMGTWTIDAGQGVDDYAVFVTNMGEVIVYNGTDPTSATTWALKGVWQLGQTFNRRCFFKFAGDLLLLTQDGLVPLASALQSSRLDPRINITDKIYQAVSQAASSYYDNYGWQVNYYASLNMLILNVPISNGIQQYVMHTITKSWANFTNINANCWEVHGKADIFFGGNGYVGRFWDGTNDNGSNINATIQQAYSYFDTRATLKRFTMARPIFISDNALPTVLVGISTDFNPVPPTGSVTFNPYSGSGSKWDVALWDAAYWAGGNNVIKQWQGVTGIGFSGGISMSIASQGVDLHWASTDIVFETGGVL